MAVTVTATPTSGVATKTAFRVSVTGLAANDTATYSSGVANSEAEIRYYFEMSEGGTVKGTSHRFTPNPASGGHTWDNIIAPDSGTYVFTVKRVSNGASMGSTSRSTTPAPWARSRPPLR